MTRDVLGRDTRACASRGASPSASESPASGPWPGPVRRRGVMKVSEVLQVKGNTLFTVSPDEMLSDCVVAMAEHDIGSLVVMEKGRLVGIVTFREVIRV